MSDNKNSLDLIVYQVGEVKSLLKEKIIKDDAFQEKMDKRVSALEIWRAGEIEKDRRGAGIDPQKIILAVLGIASSALAIAYALVQGGIVKP